MADDGDLIPVRENIYNNNRKNLTMEDKAQQQRTVSKWVREDLEDKYLRLYEENMKLKKHAHKQEDKIKRMATKLLRLVSDKKKAEQEQGVKRPVRDIETEEMLEELHGKIRELEKQNLQLREKLMVSKQQLATTGKRNTPYGYIQSRINTGIPKAPADPRITRNIRVTGPIPAQTTARAQSPTLPRYGHSLLEEARAENRHLEGVISHLGEQINIYEQDIELLKEQMRIREAEYEEDLLKIKQQVNQGQRTTIQENIDIIRMQREVKEKSTKMTQLQEQYRNLEHKLQTVRGSHDQVLNEMEIQNNHLKEEQNKNLMLQNELTSGTSAQRRLVELQERIKDLEKECDILKDANEKLVTSAFDLEREREWRQRENALKVQIAQLEATLKADVGEKGTILDKLSGERENHEKMEDDHKDLRVKYFQLMHEHDELKEKMRFFTKESTLDFTEIEEALMIVKQRRQKDDPDLDFLGKVDDERNRDHKRLIRELRAEHADTINELEKTRNMLIVQHKINKDYQMEVEAVTKKMEEDKTEYETKLQEYAQLLDIRAARIRKLEAQLRDVAYGTRQYRIRPAEDEGSDVEEIDESIHLERGQNLFEIHIKRIILSPEGINQAGDADAAIFCTWEFYEHEIQATPVMKGPKPEFQFTSQYLVKVDDFFLHYLQKDSTTLELHQSFGSEFHTLAACQLKMREILDKPRGRQHGTAQLTGIGRGGGVGVNFGTVEYWVRLRVPMEQALRLYKERSKALGYIDTNYRHTEQALQVMDEVAAKRPPNNVNQLHIKIIKCSGLQARRSGQQPSPYVIYRFFDFDDHDSTIITGTNSPQFNDHKTYPVPMTADLDRYLKSMPLDVYVFDDIDPEDTFYLGIAKIPLIPLAHDKTIKGIFELRRKDGSVNGTVEVQLKWKHSYLPPKAATQTSAQILASQHTTHVEKTPLLPGEEEQLQQSTMMAGAPDAMVMTPSPKPVTRGPQAMSTPMSKSRQSAEREEESQIHIANRLQASTRSSGSMLESQPFLPSMQEQEEAEGSEISEGTHVTGESEPVSVSETSTPREDLEDEEAPPLEAAPPPPHTDAATGVHESADRKLEASIAEVAEDEKDEAMIKAKVVLLKAALHHRQKKSLATNELQGEDGSFIDQVANTESVTIPHEQPLPQEEEEMKEAEDRENEPQDWGPAGQARRRRKSSSLREVVSDEGMTADQLIAEEMGEPLWPPTSVSDDTMFGDAPEEEEEEEVEEEEEEMEEEMSEEEVPVAVGKSEDYEDHEEQERESDSEGVVVSVSPMPRPSSSTGLGNPNVVTVNIASLSIEEDSHVMRNPDIQMLYVEYRFLGAELAETETPFSLPKPKPYSQIAFNFHKVFHIDYAKNYEQRQYLASMLLPDDPDQGRVRFTVVSEPPEEDQDGDCQDIGVAFVNIPNILSTNKDIIDEDIPIYDVQDESTEIGTMKITVECLAALKAVKQEMQESELNVLSEA